MIRIRLQVLAACLLLAGAAQAKQFVSKESFGFAKLPVLPNGTLVIQNAYGNIDVVGTDGTDIVITGEKIIRGSDDTARDEGKRLTKVDVQGNERVRVIRTLFNIVREHQWSSEINYVVRMPSTVALKIDSTTCQSIRVRNLRGRVDIENANGQILLDGVSGGVLVDTINGNITMNAPAGGGSANLSSVNGDITVHAPPTANYLWEGDVVVGDAKTNFRDVQLRIGGTSFRGVVNGPGPVLRTETFKGTVYLLTSGSSPEVAQSVRTRTPAQVVAQQTGLTQPVVRSSFAWRANLGNISIGEIRGNANVVTGAGEIRLGLVVGECKATSGGGPIALGDIVGPVTAHTEGGDILVQSAREGGTITTGGGMIRLLYAGGPTRLASGGGDIIVRQASAAINAETRSGDITITVDPATRSQRMVARTAKGNIVLNLPPNFAADVEATILTLDPNVNQMRSDIGNLSIQREQVAGGKTRIRATGKLNGGGERVDLSAEGGSIQILTVPLVASSPR